MDDKTGIRQFDGNGFADWKFRVMSLLDEKCLTPHVESAGSESEHSDSKWKKEDAVARNIIVKHVSPSHLCYVRDKKLAFDMWNNLVQTFERKSITKRIYLKKKLNSMRCNESEELQSFFPKFDDLVREFESAGGEISADEVIVQLMSSLPDIYDPVVTALEAQDITLDIDKVKTQLLEYELKAKSKREDTGATGSSAAFKAKRSDKPGPRCFNCNKYGHKRPDCPHPLRRQNLQKANAKVAFISETESDTVQFIVDS